MLIYFIFLIAIAYSATVDQSLLDIPEIESLNELVSGHYLTKHDFLRCFADGDFEDMTQAASIFAANHFVYSKNFINYLETVAHKIDSDEIRKPILENIKEESGNYEEADIAQLEAIGISKEWYDQIPHKVLSQRFFDSLDLDIKTDLDTMSPGATFTRFMLDIYETSNVCESLAIIGFAIEETVSTLYEFIWNGLNDHTELSPDEIVFFPLHIFLDDGHADLLKLGFKHYLQIDPKMCANAGAVVQSVLDRRVIMFDEVRQQIENEQGYDCKYEYSPLAIGEVEVELDDSLLNALLHDDDESDIRTTEDAVKKAQKESLLVGENDWSLLDKMAISARILAEQGHGTTLSGQISCVNEEEGTIIVNKYGKALEMVTINDFIQVDRELTTIHGDGWANKATNFHFSVYAKRPDFKCLIHTHPPKVSALSMIGQELVIAHMDTMALLDVQYLSFWPGIPFGDEEGDIISAVLSGNYSEALLAHHGLIVGAASIEEATYRAWFFERAADMQLTAMAAVGGNMSRLAKVDLKTAQRARDWRGEKGPVNSHFKAWAHIALMKAKNQNNYPLKA